MFVFLFTEAVLVLPRKADLELSDRPLHGWQLAPGKLLLTGLSLWAVGVASRHNLWSLRASKASVVEGGQRGGGLVTSRWRQAGAAFLLFHFHLIWDGAGSVHIQVQPLS